MKKFLLILTIIFAAGAVQAQAQLTDADRDAIKQTALDYAEGWYEGNAERMERSLHPRLAKRIARQTPQGQTALGEMSALELVQGTRGGSGKQTAKAEQQKDVTILDALTGSATVKLEMRDWVDYMHIAKFNGRWVIVNVLWELKPQKRAENGTNEKPKQ